MRLLTLSHALLSITGIFAALYSMHVEAMLIQLPGYSPACDISSWAMSCSKVFTSKYARPLSNWGLAKERSLLDLSLPQLALFYFVPALIFPIVRTRFPFTSDLFRLLSHASLAFNVYLACILKFVLGEFCVVCALNYIVVLGLWVTINRLAGEGETVRGKKVT